MKKLHLLKPDVRKRFVGEKKDEEVQLIYVPNDLDEKCLDEDIKAGAKQFESVKELLGKKKSRVTIIDCDNREQGMLAVSYLAAIRYQMERGETEDVEQMDDAHLDQENGIYDEKDKPLTNDFEEKYSEDDEEFDDPYDMCNSYREHPRRIPVIEMNEILGATSRNPMNHIFWDHNTSMMGNGKTDTKRPYWFLCTGESVCIMAPIIDLVKDNMRYADPLGRFSSNKYVYLVLVRQDYDDGTYYGMYDEEDSEENDNLFVCEMALEHTAQVVKVRVQEEKNMAYYKALFDSWLQQMGCTTAKGFPKEKIINGIIRMRKKNKSALMEKFIRYILQEQEENCVLTEKHFELLKRFHLLEQKKKKTGTGCMDEELVGMEDVKRQITDIIQVMKYNKAREQNGLPNGDYHNVHMFIGAPGTAKTTVAKMLGNEMAKERLLSGGRFISINGAELKGKYVGHSAPKTKSLFDNYDIIFIDEAYSISASGDKELDSFSQEAIAQLIIEMEKHATDKLVMFAGYGGKNVSEKDNKMRVFLDANPGIKSRINSTVYFDSYTPEQMVDIVRQKASNMQFVITKDADVVMLEYFKERVDCNDFGNGREARSFLEECQRHAAHRVMSLPPNKITKKTLKQITLEDVENTIRRLRNSNEVQEGRKYRLGFV